MTSQVAHWRGLVERYGGSTTEILSIEERESRMNGDEDSTAVIVTRSLEEQLRKAEALQEGKLNILSCIIDSPPDGH